MVVSFDMMEYMKTFYGFPIPSRGDVNQAFVRTVSKFSKAAGFLATIWVITLIVQQFGGDLGVVFNIIVNILLIGTGILTVLAILVAVFIVFMSSQKSFSDEYWLNGAAQILASQASNTIVPLLLMEEVSTKFPVFKNVDFRHWLGLMAMYPVVNGQPYSATVAGPEGSTLNIIFPVVVDDNGDGKVTIEVELVRSGE